MKNTRIVLGILVVLGGIVLGKPVDISAQKDVISVIRQIFEEYSYPAEWSSNRHGYYLSSTVKTFVRDNPTASVSNIEILVGKEQVHFISNEKEIYRDVACSYWVDHKRKSIIVTAIPYSNNASLQHSQSLNTLHDTLFGYCSIRSSNEIKGSSGEKLQSSVLDLNQKGKKKFGIQSVTVIFDPNRRTLNQINTVFTDESKIARIETVYHKLDRSYATDRLSKPLISFLKNKYKGYVIDDLRKVTKP